MTGTLRDLGQVHRLPLASIRPYPANARLITAKAVEQTAASLREFGWQQPLVIDRERVLVVGHVRHRAALSLGAAEGPAVYADHLSAKQVRAYRIADNRTHDYTAWDYGVLAAELSGLDDFAGVLDLADWGAIVAGLPAADAEGGGLFGDDGAPAILGSQAALTVVFDSQEAADRAGPALLALPGVVNVRHAR